MKHILPIIMEGTDENTIFYDCFGGGMNVVSEIPLKTKVVYDTNRYLIKLWNEIKKNGVEALNLPKDSTELTQEKYNDIKQSYINNDHRYPDYLIGYVGSSCSYGGAWFNGYAKFNENKGEDHVKEAYNGLVKQVNNFKYLDTTEFVCASYKVLFATGKPSKNSVIFCDPPYMETKKYEGDFDHVEFWKWVRDISRDGYKTYVTEYSAPTDFKCIWSAEKKDGMGTTKTGVSQSIKIEKMFVLHGRI